MNAFDKHSIRTIEAPDEIQFILVRQTGWATRTLSIGVILAVFWYALRSSNPVWFLFPVFGAVPLIADSIHGRVTAFQVTETNLSARGNLDRTFQDQFDIEITAVKSIGFQSGYEDCPSGLYVTHGWKSTCVLPGINKEECSQIVGAIYRKFPDLDIGDRDSGSLLFGPDGGLVALEISKRQ